MPAPDDEVTIEIKTDMRKARDGLVELSKHASSFSATITGAFRSAVAGGRSFETVLNTLALKLAAIAFDRALQPISNIIGGAIHSVFAGFGLADGGVIAGGRLKPFARGGIVASPTVFPLQGGLGVAGEAGAEAVLPLARGADGRLGVAGEGGRPMVVNVNVTTPDVEGFRKSEAQVTAMLARAVGRGRRGL